VVADDLVPSVDGAAEEAGRDHTTIVRRQIRGSTLLLVGQGVSLALAFLTQILIVRYLSKAGYGAFAYALSLVAIVQTLSTFGVTRAIARLVPMFREREDRASASNVIGVALTVIVGLGASVLLAVIGLHGFLGSELISDRTTRALVLLIVVLAPIQAVDDLMINLFAVFHRVRSIFGRTYLVAPVLRLVAALVTIAVGGTAKTLAVGYVVAAAIGLVVYGALLFRLLTAERIRPRFPRRGFDAALGPLLGLAAPVFAADLAYVVMTSADALLIGHFKGAAEVGAFKAVQPAARLNEVVFGTFLVLFTPLAAQLLVRGDRAGLTDLYWQTASWITVLSFPIFALTFGLADPLVELLFGSRYADSGTYLAILSVGFYVQAAFGFNGTTLMVYGRAKYIVFLGVLGIALNLALNLALIPRYGALGAAIGTATSFVLYNVFKQIGLRMATGVPVLARGYGLIYVSVVAGAGVVAAAQHGLGLSLLPGLLVAALVSVAVIAVNRGRLRAAATFPELARFPLARRVLGVGGG
jgi:O-antigen/teichoic acid export membrane protein